MSYRNKTYIAFASENIGSYRMMEAWRDNDNIDFDFIDAHDLYISRDTSSAETIKANLRQRMSNAKQFVLLGSVEAKRKGSDGNSFLAFEIETMLEKGLPIVIANLGGSRNVKREFIPSPLLDSKYYTMSVSFQPKIIMYALDDYAVGFKNTAIGPYQYKPSVYEKLGL